MSSPPGRVAGIDYGSVRIGIAVCDRERKIASPLDNYARRGPQEDARFFRELAAAEAIVLFVVGLPLHLDGQESRKSAEARRFGDWLSAATGLPVEFFDERFTTVEAEGFLLEAGLTHKRRTQRRDMVAAQIMLAAYLEPRAPGGQSPRGLDE